MMWFARATSCSIFGTERVTPAPLFLRHAMILQVTSRTFKHACVAALAHQVERGLCNPEVVRSSRTRGTSLHLSLSGSNILNVSDTCDVRKPF